MLLALKSTDSKGNGSEHSITFVKANRQLKTGGGRKTIRRAVWLKNFLPAPKRVRNLEGRKQAPSVFHERWINLVDADTHETVKIHPRLVLYFDGQKMEY